MDTKTGWIITGVTTALCGCPGACIILSGAANAMGWGTENAEIFGESASGQTPLFVGISSLCVGLLFFAIPVVIGLYTYMQDRKARFTAEVDINEELPPTI